MKRSNNAIDYKHELFALRDNLDKALRLKDPDDYKQKAMLIKECLEKFGRLATNLRKEIPFFYWDYLRMYYKSYTNYVVTMLSGIDGQPIRVGFNNLKKVSETAYGINQKKIPCPEIYIPGNRATGQVWVEQRVYFLPKIALLYSMDSTIEQVKYWIEGFLKRYERMRTG